VAPALADPQPDAARRLGPVLYMASTKLLVGFLGNPARLQPDAAVSPSYANDGNPLGQ
jgi:hypothetical protein